MSSVAASSPTARSSESGMDFDMSTAASTVVPSSPASATKDSLERVNELENDIFMPNDASEPPANSYLSPTETLQTRLHRLNVLLEKSSMYTAAVGERMNQAHVADQDTLEDESSACFEKSPTKKGRGVRTAAKTGQKRRRGEDDDGDGMNKRTKVEKDNIGRVKLVQPEEIVNVKLKDYQLLGVEWLISLYINGVNGILADEMGLGLTLQTIAFLARVPESRPALIVCPLSVLHNWVAEFGKFAPSIPVCMYHGTPAQRAEIRLNMNLHECDSVDDDSSKKPLPPPKKRGKKRTSRAQKQENSESNEVSPKKQNNLVVVTTYEMIIKDRKYLSKHTWNFIVVDEGHRLKNMDCRLIQEIKKYTSANRLILTGTPLHNNLAELWSLLNFILPDIFSDLASFQEWFNLPDMQSALPSEHSTQVISKLHTILKPFLLRRLKADVEHSLPPKKEYVLYAPLSERQRELYDAIVNGVLRNYLIDGKQEKAKAAAVVTSEGRIRRRRNDIKYDVDGDDEDWFANIERGNPQPEKHEEELEAGRKFFYKNSVKKVNSMKLQNTIMQLRKVCSHPFLFEWPIDHDTGDFVINDELVSASGKMMILDRLLSELSSRKHKVLLFSQFTTMLDIIEEWATSFKSWRICRIDGSTKPEERRAEMERFQSGGDNPDAPTLFLLSTRAGGLGITLTAADTVIFYDQDWNPQMDIQAQDRAHRIGQTKPVLIFRLVSAHTIETTIMKRANQKRQLEALIIAKGKFRMPGSVSKPKTESIAEIAANLLRLEGEKIEVVPNSEAKKAKLISDADLDKLLDRSADIFIDRRQGWTSGQKEGDKAKSGDVAFEVFHAPADQCNDSLATMMAEDE